MTVPDYQTLMLPLLRIASEGQTRVARVESRIADEFGLTQEERNAMLPSRRQGLLRNRLHWAKFYMGKAGLIDTPAHGIFLASAEGRALLSTKPSRIDVELLLSYPSFREFRRAEQTPDTSAIKAPTSLASAQAVTQTTTPEEQIETAHAAMQASLRVDLLQRILQNTPGFFEQVIVGLLVAMGYGGSHRSAAQQLGRTGDGGVDGVIDEDRLGLDRVYVQAKRYAPTSSVGRPDVQAFVGSLVGLGASKGVFVTTSSFSTQAREFVQHLAQRVILIDGTRLTELMVEHNVGVRVSRSIEFKRIDEDFFSEEE